MSRRGIEREIENGLMVQDVGEKNGCDFETVWGFFGES